MVDLVRYRSIPLFIVDNSFKKKLHAEIVLYVEINKLFTIIYRTAIVNCTSYILNKKERYIKFSFKLRVFHLNIVKECIVIFNHQCSMVATSCRGDR